MRLWTDRDYARRVALRQWLVEQGVDPAPAVDGGTDDAAHPGERTEVNRGGHRAGLRIWLSDLTQGTDGAG